MMKRVFLLLGLAVLVCAPASAQAPRGASQDSSARPDLRGVYARWLSEDVSYIITPVERRAFTLLKSDAEREQFVEAFWLRRDPRPDTATNEYRDEHYARLAHANQSFAAGDTLGWRTDRGRTYITLGKPDEVLKTSTGEVWVYRHAPGFGSNVEIKFVDANGTGDLRLQP